MDDDHYHPEKIIGICFIVLIFWIIVGLGWWILR